MQKDSTVFVGLDTSKMKISVALAEQGRQGEVRFLGDIESTPETVRRLVAKLSGKYGKLSFCYEAGPTGYGLHRQILELGHACTVIAPSLIPTRPGERVKTNRRDAVTLARLHRAGELTAISVPDPDHEAIRDVVRAREAAMEDLREKRQHLQSFLLRHGRIYAGHRPWTKVHARWLAALVFDHPAQYLVLREYRQAIQDDETRQERLMAHVVELASSWSMAPVVAAYQAMRGDRISYHCPPRCKHQVQPDPGAGSDWKQFILSNYVTTSSYKLIFVKKGMRQQVALSNCLSESKIAAASNLVWSKYESFIRSQPTRAFNSFKRGGGAAI